VSGVGDGRVGCAASGDVFEEKDPVGGHVDRFFDHINRGRN